MQHSRYGRFYFRDYLSTWIICMLLILIIVYSLFLGIEHYWLVFPFFVCLFMIWTVIHPNTEKFSIINNTFKIERSHKIEFIIPPSELTLVISYADICDPVIKRLGIPNQSYFLKNRYAVSVLPKLPIEDLIDSLHGNYIKKYTSTSIERAFSGGLYIYGFVCNDYLLNELINNWKCLLIIPESLTEKINVNSNSAEIYVDKGY